MIADEKIIGTEVRVTGAHGLPLKAIIEAREEDYPILDLCQRCAFDCKKHGARNLKFECFEFKSKKEIK